MTYCAVPIAAMLLMSEKNPISIFTKFIAPYGYTPASCLVETLYLSQ